MSGISGISNSYSSYSMYGKIASGLRIQSSADDAAGLAISEKLTSQENGLNKGTQNAQSGQNLLNVSDGALGSITDNLQRIRELAVQASNGLLTDSDKKDIQAEVDQLKQGIGDIADQTTFNTKPLLNGDSSLYMATDSNGNSVSVNTTNATLSSLGIEDFDVTGNFSIDTIDKALDKVTTARAKGGAQYNALSSTISYNNYAAQNTAASNSRIEDLDIPKALTDLTKQNLLNTYKIFMQKSANAAAQNRNTVLFR